MQTCEDYKPFFGHLQIVSTLAKLTVVRQTQDDVILLKNEQKNIRKSKDLDNLKPKVTSKISCIIDIFLNPYYISQFKLLPLRI